MSDSANKLPVMTDEQRRENLEKATAVRKERKALLDLVRQGSVTFEQASADPKCWRIPVVRLLIAVPGIGKARRPSSWPKLASPRIVESRASVAASETTSSTISPHPRVKPCSHLRCSCISRRSYQSMLPPWPCSFVLGWRRGCGVVFLVFDRFYFMGRVSRFPDTPFV